MFLSCLMVAASIFVFYPMYDEWLGTPLTERVQVEERRRTPAGSRFNGKTYSPVREMWNLRVANSNGSGWVEVHKTVYEKTAVGDRFTVTGRRGRFTRHWYLKEAFKKP